MAQHDYVIDNQSFPATRSDLNSLFQAIASSNSGATAPSTTYANQIWYDTANNKLYIRNEDNDAWIELFVLDQTGDHLEKIGNTITLDGAGNTTLDGDLTIPDKIIHSGDTNTTVRFPATDTISFETGGSERSRVDSTGNLLIAQTSGSSSDVGHILAPTGAAFHIRDGGIPLILDRLTSDGEIVRIRKDGATYGNISAVSSGLTFGTGSSGTERMRITSGGDVTTTGSSTFSRANAGFTARSGDSVSMTRINGTVLEVNRSNDGTLVNFFSAQVAEGTISVSGSTVSYNGGHLSRWSQLTDGTKDTSIVKGTVMTNLDQMAVWSHDAVAATYYVDGDELPEITPATYYTEDDTLPDGVSVGDEKTAAVYAQVGDEKTPAVDAFTEDNEQLNCMAVSSVEGDTNVAGVFVNWDNDDDQFNDMNVAMTGDMVIRIAQGTTVARGDLLMSAGDGTAKPQDDDIVRSKTIAKVTSTHVSHTYDDGSYLVPCVLMAC